MDGFYVTLWRLMLRYPELLAWEMLWTDSLRDTYKAIYQTAKAADRNVGVGWHIWHNNSFNPIYRAEQDLQTIAPVSDFLKIVIYHNCGGERLASYIDSVGQTAFGDVPKQELLDFHYRVLDYANEKPIADMPRTGLSSEYVLRETKRARAGLQARRHCSGLGSTSIFLQPRQIRRVRPKERRPRCWRHLRAAPDGVLLSQEILGDEARESARRGRCRSRTSARLVVYNVYVPIAWLVDSASNYSPT